MMMLELSSMAVFMSAVVVAAKLKLVCNEPDTQKKETGQISVTCLIGCCSQLLKRDTTKMCMT